MSRKKSIAVSTLLAGAFALLGLLNAGGWRARIFARLLRTNNQPVVVAPPSGFQPQVPAGFKTSILASGFEEPRWIAIAPNGDVFVADSAAGKVIALHAPLEPRGPVRDVFADHLNLPFGIAFNGAYAYVATTDEVLRFRYDPRTSKRLGDSEPILDLPGGGYNQHWTRSLAFSLDGKRMFISVGSKTNVSIESDPRRAAILVADPDGKNMRIYASGLRNAAGIAFNSESESLWATVNERDDLGDDVPADFFTHVVEGGFYGWPYAYLGPSKVDNRVRSRPDLAAKTLAPDLLLGAHVAPLQFAFYEGKQFPPTYRQGAFIAEHGSWNRRIRSGYQVVFVPFGHAAPAGGAQPFFSGFVPNSSHKEVYGRMVGVAVAPDGSLLVSDDGQKVIWRIAYEPQGN